jgi:hypothetical protein
MIRVIVTRQRDWTAYNIATVVLSRLIRRYGRGGFVIVHGDCGGIDATFREACRDRQIPEEAHPARWDELGKKAGPIRNQEMVDAGADFAIAVHRSLGYSRGTSDCVRRCLAAGIPVYWIASNDVVPIRVRSLDGTSVITAEEKPIASGGAS